MVTKSAVSLLLFLLGLVFSFAQSPDSSGTTLTQVTDPLQNRLFIMPTGKILEEGRVTLTTIDVFLLQAFYSPTDYLQINVGGVLPVHHFVSGYESESYFSYGTKFQLLRQSGLFQGLSLGADVSYYGKRRAPYTTSYGNAPDGDYYSGAFDNIMNNLILRANSLVASFNVAASIEFDALQAHCNIDQLYFQFAPMIDPIDETLPMPSFFQVGFAYDLGTIQRHTGLKFIAEALLSNQNPKGPIELSALCPGMRIYSKSLVLDIAILVEKEAEMNYRIHYPYIGLNFFL
ncbi:MAG: hypothetical protein EPO24_14160 [Bacteroidetes bacterium]|nr:MAG: hypothetical protein EPO24_14160 [Bacteroidota bacterium]